MNKEYVARHGRYPNNAAPLTVEHAVRRSYGGRQFTRNQVDALG